jgi:ribosome maturation factor RimP
MIAKDAVKQIVEEKIDGTDYFLVDVKITSDNQISIEIDAEKGVDLNFCAELSRFIEAQLDRETEDFSLEVGSSGITQPFKVLRQYLKNVGKEVEVLQKDGKKVSGILLAADGNGFTVQTEKQVKPEGAKRKITVKEDITYKYEDVKSTVYKLKV